MEKMIEALDNFIELYVLGSAIESVSFSNETEKWAIKYKHNVKADEFDSAKDMIEFLYGDQHFNIN
jgi:uncharacterized protein YkuJ